MKADLKVEEDGAPLKQPVSWSLSSAVTPPEH